MGAEASCLSYKRGSKLGWPPGQRLDQSDTVRTLSWPIRDSHKLELFNFNMLTEMFDLQTKKIQSTPTVFRANEVRAENKIFSRPALARDPPIFLAPSGIRKGEKQ